MGQGPEREQRQAPALSRTPQTPGLHLSCSLPAVSALLRISVVAMWIEGGLMQRHQTLRGADTTQRGGSRSSCSAAGAGAATSGS